MIVLRDSNYTGLYTADYLVRAGFVVFGKVGNEYVALQMPVNMVEYSKNIREVIVETTKHEPLYKQQMNMMLGRPLRDKTERRRYRFYPISEENRNRYRYKIVGASYQ